MISHLLTKRRPGKGSLTYRWGVALLSPIAAFVASPVLAGEAGICNVAGTQCSVFLKVAGGAAYSFANDPAPFDGVVASDTFHLAYSVTESNWVAYDADDPQLPTFDVAWRSPAFGAIPFSGDWDGDGNDGVGIATSTAGWTRFALGEVLTHSMGGPSIQERTEYYELPASGVPIIGDWNGDGIDSVGVYSNGVFTLIDNPVAGRPGRPFQMDLSALLPAQGAQNVQPITWPWQWPANRTDFIGLALPDRIVAVDRYRIGYVHGATLRPIGIHEAAVASVYPERPVTFEGKNESDPVVGAFIAPPGHCVDADGDGDCDAPSNPEENSGGIRPGIGGNWFP